MGNVSSNDAAGNPVRFVFTAATSVTESVAMTVPLTRLPSANDTWTVWFVPTTCATVAITPFDDHTTPLPSPSDVSIVTIDGSTRAPRWECCSKLSGAADDEPATAVVVVLAVVDPALLLLPLEHTPAPTMSTIVATTAHALLAVYKRRMAPVFDAEP